jgi:hypothetical protein
VKPQLKITEQPHSFRWWFWHFDLALFILAGACWSFTGGHGNPADIGCLIVALAVGFLGISVEYCKWFLGVIDDGYKALEPLPTPQEIAVGLEDTLGRQPSIEEVAAMQQMLSHEKNQQLIRSGVTIGAVFLIGRNSGL